MNNKIIEALMFIQGELGISPRDLKGVLEISTSEARQALKEFKEQFNGSDRALIVLEAGDNFKFVTRKEFDEPITKLVAVIKKQRLSAAAIETAGIIAYKQPITKSQVNEIRGVASEAVVNTLLVKGIIEEKGIAQTPGSPILYGISNKFYDYFQINSLKELPKITELEETEGLEDDFDLFSSQRQDENEEI